MLCFSFDSLHSFLIGLFVVVFVPPLLLPVKLPLQFHTSRALQSHLGFISSPPRPQPYLQPPPGPPQGPLTLWPLRGPANAQRGPHHYSLLPILSHPPKLGWGKKPSIERIIKLFNSYS